MNSVFANAVSGLNAAIARLANAAQNIANVKSTGTLPSSASEQTTAFVPQDIVTLSQDTGDATLGVTTTRAPRTPAYTPAYDPSSPEANAQGLVAAPNVDPADEAVTALMAEIAYKANAKVIAAEKKNQETLVNTIT